MKFKVLIEEITTAAFAGWSENPSKIGFDLPREAAENIMKMRKGKKINHKSDLSVLFGLNRREYANMIGTVPDYYNKEVKKIFKGE